MSLSPRRTEQASARAGCGLALPRASRSGGVASGASLRALCREISSDPMASIPKASIDRAFRCPTIPARVALLPSAAGLGGGGTSSAPSGSFSRPAASRVLGRAPGSALVVPRPRWPVPRPTRCVPPYLRIRDCRASLRCGLGSGLWSSTALSRRSGRESFVHQRVST